MTDQRQQLRQLAAQLADLPGDAIAEKYEISVEMDALRANLPAFHSDDGRSRRDMELELAEHRSHLKEIMKSSAVSITPMSDGAGGAGDASHIQLRATILRSADWIRTRIGELEAALVRLDNLE